MLAFSALPGHRGSQAVPRERVGTARVGGWKLQGGDRCPLFIQKNSCQGHFILPSSRFKALPSGSQESGLGSSLGISGCWGAAWRVRSPIPPSPLFNLGQEGGQMLVTGASRWDGGKGEEGLEGRHSPGQ